VPRGLQATSPGARLYRVGRAPDPWAWPDWSNAAADGTFGSRWDDPASAYRVLYAASSRLGAFVEVLARFRPDPRVRSGLAEIEGGDGRFLAPGSLDASWLARRRLGEATVAGRFADVGHSASLAQIRRDLAGRVVHYGLPDLDASTIRLAAPRRFTQEVSRYVYERTARGGRRAFDGISYLSRLGDEFRNWAIFEPATEAAARAVARRPAVREIAPDDPDLRRALEIHGVRLVGLAAGV
jgi:hypothetical protein